MPDPNNANEAKVVRPERSRAVFSNEDFQLIRVAISHHLKDIKEGPEAIKYSNLYHRLGRLE